jgi:hypothetical protein
VEGRDGEARVGKGGVGETEAEGEAGRDVVNVEPSTKNLQYKRTEEKRREKTYL